MLYKSFFGIDFGTTCSGVSVYTQDNKGQLIQKTADHCGNEIGEPDSSFVAINKETNEVLCGYSAWKKRNKLANNYELIPSIKMELRTDKDIITNIKGKKWTAGDVAAELFKHIKILVNDMQYDMNEAVVAIPIGYPAEARKVILKAATTAGIRIKQFISEPTAAYMANKKELGGYSNVLVFDWGGGTLDISILHISKGKISELATGGMDEAGNEINEILAEKIHNQMIDDKGIAINFNMMPKVLIDEIENRAEKLKKDFSDSDNVRFMIRKYGDFGNYMAQFNYEEWFKPLLRPIVKKAIACVKKTLNEAQLTEVGIDKVLMVGGSSNLRPICEEMAAIFGENKIVKPDGMAWSISDGAAYLAMNNGKYISNQDVGIILSDGTKYNFLTKGTPLKGFSSTQTFGITDSTKQMRLVFTGSDDIDQSPDKYKTIVLKNIFDFLDEGISVSAKVNSDIMVLTVSAESNLVKNGENPTWQYENLKCSFELPEE